MDRYADKIPEVLSAPISELLRDSSTVRLDGLDDDVQYYIIQLVFDKFVQFFNGVGNMLSNDGDIEMNICIWRSGLCDLNIKQILHGLYAVLTGKTEYQKYPPSSPVAFYCICKSNVGGHSSDEEETRKIISGREEMKRSSEEYAAKWWGEIRKITRATKPRYRDGD